jgi:hypothetical protein
MLRAASLAAAGCLVLIACAAAAAYSLLLTGTACSSPAVRAVRAAAAADLGELEQQLVEGQRVGVEGPGLLGLN